MAIEYLQGLMPKKYYKSVQAKAKRLERLRYKIRRQYRQYLGNKR